MSTGRQKYRRTEFEDNDDNNSAGEANSPGVVYNPVIAFHAAGSFGPGAGLIGRGCCARRSGLEKLLLGVVGALSVVVLSAAEMDEPIEMLSAACTGWTLSVVVFVLLATLTARNGGGGGGQGDVAGSSRR